MSWTGSPRRKRAVRRWTRTLASLLPWLSPTVTKAVLFVVGTAAFFGLLRWVHRLGAARALRIELLKAGVPVCPKCGYLLEGLPDDADRCPECGREFDDRVLGVLGRVDGTEDPGRD